MKKSPTGTMPPSRALQLIGTRLPIRAIPLLLLLAAVHPISANAQFFGTEDLQTAQGRANNQASQTTDKAIDKVPGSGAGGSTKSGLPAGGSPDTSAAGMMKMLGMMTGGGGVSASDSAAAINIYKNGSG